MSLIEEQIRCSVPPNYISSFTFLENELTWPADCILCIFHPASPVSKNLLERFCVGFVAGANTCSKLPRVICGDGYALTVEDLKKLPAKLSNGEGLIVFVSQGSFEKSFCGSEVDLFLDQFQQQFLGN